MAEDPPDRLASQHALADAYQANGRVKEAVVQIRTVTGGGSAVAGKDGEETSQVRPVIPPARLGCKDNGRFELSRC